MGIAKKTDGRYVVGVGVENANEYKGSASYRDIYIQLTSSGATEQSEEYLNYLKDYAVYANSLGEPIMPPSVNVWISNNGVTTAVEADDVSIDGENYTICGIKWNGSAWDYSDAGKGGGIPPFTASDIGKVLMVVDYGDGEERVIVPPQAKFFMGDPRDTVELANVDLTAFVVGATATLTVFAEDGSVPTTEYSVTCTEGEDGVRTFSSQTCPFTIFIDSHRFVFATSEDEGYLVISLTQVTPNPQLEWRSIS